MLQIVRRFKSHLDLAKCLQDNIKLLKSYHSSSIIPDDNEEPENLYQKYENLPSAVTKKTTKINSLHLFDKTVAKNFMALIKDDLLINNTSFYVELNPGIGLMTRELLEAGVPTLHSYEKMDEFKDFLQPIVNEYSQRLNIRNYDFLKVAKMEYIDDQTNSKKLKNLLDGIEEKEWKDEPAIKIIGAVPNMTFFYYLQYSLIDKCLAKFGRIVLYVAILPSMSLAFQDLPENSVFHTGKTVFLRNIFNYKYLGSVPRQAFNPEATKKKTKRHFRYFKNDHEIMDIVKIETNVNFLNDNFNRNDALMFMFFLKIQMRRRNTRIIPALEKWISGCGPRLIKKNITIFTTFSELKSYELIDLFKEFKSWPEYETCPFIEIVESTIQSQSRKVRT